MDAFIKQKVITPKVPSSFSGDRKQSNFLGTAKKSATSSVVDAGTTPRTEKKVVDTTSIADIHGMLKRRKQVTPPRTSSSDKRRGSAGKKKFAKTSKQAAFMANFFGAKKAKQFSNKGKLAVRGAPDNKTKTVAQGKIEATLSAASLGNAGPECKTKGVTDPSVCRKRPISALKSSPSASSPALKRVNVAKDGEKAGMPSMPFVAKKQKKLILHGDTPVQSPQATTTTEETLQAKATEPGLDKHVCNEDDSEESSDESSSDESGLEDAEGMEDMDPELLKKHAEQKMRQAMELEEEEKKAAELEAARIQAAAELLLKQEEERESKENLVVINETMDEIINVVTLDILRERCTSDGDSMNIKDVVYCYDMTGVHTNSVIAPLGLLYKADILKIGMRKFGGKTSTKGREKAYRVHFHGFSKRWDTQVPQSRLLNVNDASNELCETTEIIFDSERKKIIEEEEKLKAEEERLEQEAKAREPPSSKVLHQAAAKRLENASFPITLESKGNGTTTVLQLGVLKEGFLYNSQKQLFPVGFQSEFEHCSYKDVTKKAKYLQTLKQGLSGSQRPIFEIRLKGADATDEDLFQGNNASSVWKIVNDKLRLQSKAQGKAYHSVNGKDAFGYANKNIVALLEGLPNVLQANGYVFQDRRLYEGLEEQAKSSPAKRQEKKKLLPKLTTNERKQIQNDLAKYSTKFKHLLLRCKELQKETKFWRKQRVLKKIGLQWKRGDNKYHGKINELLSDENVAAAITKYIQGNRATLSQLVKNVLKGLRQKRHKVDEETLANFIKNNAKRVTIGTKATDCTNKEEAYDSMDRHSFWVWVVKKQELLFKNRKNVYRQEKQKFRDLKLRLDAFSKYINQYKKCIDTLTDEYVTFKQCLSCRQYVDAAEATYEAETAKFEARYKKACEASQAEMKAMKEKEMRRIEREKLLQQRRLAKEQAKIERQKLAELKASERAAQKAEKERQLLLEKQLKQEELEKQKLTSFGLIIKRTNNANNGTGTVNTNGLTNKTMMKTILIPLMNELVHHAYNEAYVKEIDNLTSKISNSQDHTGLFEEFKNRSLTSKAVATKEKQKIINRKQLLQFSENQRPAFWGNYFFRHEFECAKGTPSIPLEATVVAYNAGTLITKLKPLTQDTTVVTSYDLDSDEEWEDGQPAEELGSDMDDEDDEEEKNEDNEMDFGDGWLLGDDEVIYEGENGGPGMMSGDYESDGESDGCSEDDNGLKERRVLSTYMLWLKDNREKLQAEVMQCDGFEQSKLQVLISKHAGETWAKLTVEEKGVYLDLREKLVQEAKEEFEALKLANKDVKKMKRKKTHKFANNSEIGHEVVLGVFYDTSEKNDVCQSSLSQLLQYSVLPLTLLPIKASESTPEDASSQVFVANSSGNKNMLGFKKVSREQYRKEMALQREAKRIKLEAEKQERIKAKQKQRQLRLENLEKEKLERMKLKEEERKLRLQKLEVEKQQRAKKLQEREKERERVRLEKKKAAELKARERLEQEKMKQIKTMHLKPFLSAMHNKQKKKFALDGFRSQFPAVSKQNLEKLLKLICVRESRDFDRIKWYVKDEYRKLILSNPEECMIKINGMLGATHHGKRKAPATSPGIEGDSAKKMKLT